MSEVANPTTPAAPAAPTETKKRNFLSTLIGRPVVVKLKFGVTYHGILACIDGRMNVALEQTEEYVDGRLTSQLGDALIRGSCVLYISLKKKKTIA